MKKKFLTDAKVLISDIEKFIATDPYLVLADKENSEIPPSRYITGNSDAMWEKNTSSTPKEIKMS